MANGFMVVLGIYAHGHHGHAVAVISQLGMRLVIFPCGWRREYLKRGSPV